jgi:hypothetical protein
VANSVEVSHCRVSHGEVVALRIKSKHFIFLPSEQSEDYVFGKLMASKIVLTLDKFISIDHIIKQLNTQSITEFDFSIKNYDSYVLVKT